MSRVDVNCLWGHWPYRKLYKNTFKDLQRIHQENGIATGYISSMNSIFYNDPFEGEEELHAVIKGSGYQHIFTTNPQLPRFIEDIQKGIDQFNIKGVRVYPGYHQYGLDDENLQRLCEFLHKKNLPLFLTLRLEDPRMNYLTEPRVLTTDEIKCFVEQYPKNQIVLLTIFLRELVALRDTICAHENLQFDTSGLKDQLFVIEKLLTMFAPNKIAYGSLYPLYCLKSTLFTITQAEIEEGIKEKILEEK